MRHQISFKSQELFWKLIPLFFFIGVMISYPLWTSQRAFPSFPVFSFEIPNWLDLILQFLFFGILFIQFFKRIWFRAFIFLLIVMIFIDQMRIQPWVYFYSLLLLPLLFKLEKTAIKSYHQWCFIGLYIWSGFNKLNPNFTALIFESMLVDGFRIVNPETISTLKNLSYSVPLLEILAGILLIITKTRKIAIALGVIGHVFILYYLVIGLQGNWVVVPWNIFLLLGLFFLFYKNDQKLAIPKSLVLKLSLLIILFVFPIGNRLGFADQSLAFSLYDGKLKSAYIPLENKSDSFPDNAYVLSDFIENGAIIGFNSWSFQELQVPFYPEDRFLKHLAKEYNRKVLVTEVPLWDRTITQQFKTTIEKRTTQQLVDFVQFKDKVWIPEFVKINP